VPWKLVLKKAIALELIRPQHNLLKHRQQNLIVSMLIVECRYHAWSVLNLGVITEVVAAVRPAKLAETYVTLAAHPLVLCAKALLVWIVLRRSKVIAVLTLCYKQ